MNWILPVLLLAVIVLMPRYGALALYREWRKARQREQVEDALKHLLDREQQGRHASPESLAGMLNLSRVKVTRLITDMEAQGLLETHGPQLYLTPEGERWAMHIVRAHRLWERYLVDEARMPLNQIHGEAHKREHAMTDAQLDEMDAALGHPTRDPHGDPIPSREGKMPSVQVTPLTAWETEGPAQIVHIEDEPAIAFDQILATGLHLGQSIRILEHTPQRIVLSDGENEYRLAPTIAANIGVAPLLSSERAKTPIIPLAELTHNQRGEIIELDDAVQGFTRRRFLDLGLTPGTTIYPELGNFFGDPRAYRVRGTLIALRRDQAAQIWVKPISG
jgi:DtxR family transcriptional regulator, Mn-dependent transcriptional regulator